MLMVCLQREGRLCHDVVAVYGVEFGVVGLGSDMIGDKKAS